MVCKICGKDSQPIFKRTVLAKYEVAYYQCSSCEFIQTEEPYWIHEAYETSLNIEDTGIIARNTLCVKRASSILFAFYNHQKPFLDYGGGSGLFVRMMRDKGFDFFWKDPYTANIFARGFEAESRHNERFEAVTSFECFEHFVDPHKEIQKMLSFAPSIIFSTEIFRRGTPSPEDWKYYYFSHGQHIALYSLKSLQSIAEQYNLHLLTNNKSFHVLIPEKHTSLFYQVLLKASAMGLPALLSLIKKSKTRSDSEALEQQRTTPSR